ncbi:DUF4148 domain-containing protein [Paraburkholderia sp. MMS20-SJTR3]|uniref:DUF4148 domain-containing protein n=1 Tax=Paraburkholderia sejongensis TaxID=2886946 RepID=A0ABS8K110_9BURK|nr:DUF4148 domain-containing protein [Paraburkholderia sp. MMS20-SJTR3]MCC8395858.1 DUF4148 domain-containing protein [Paraburkholderia sp. MMS20-SJTR3]
MNVAHAGKRVVLLGSIALAIGVSGGAFAQTPAGGDAGANATHAANAANAAVQPTPAASAPLSKAERKAQRKAARKEAKAKNAAEIKRLKDAGYQPGQNDPNYPENIQKAERKAAAAQGASQ